MPNSGSVFTLLDMKVLSMDSGVYWLRHKIAGTEHIGLLYRDALGDPGALSVFLFEVPASVPAEEIQAHWKTLDARRLAASGLVPQSLRIQVQPELEEPLLYVRPDGERIRHAVKLQTGEVACYN